MYNILIWGTGREYNNYLNCIRLLELKEQISIVGITSNDRDITTSVDNYPFVKKEDLNSLDFDYCIVAIANMSIIINEAESLGIEKSKLIPIRVLSIPNIDFNEYIKLKNSHLTIFSPNCWAGICYHRLGLEFLSPTINMFEDRDDFNKLMINLDTYMSYSVEFIETRYDKNLKREYPVGLLNDILLHFNHYESFDQALSCWEKRKQRINKDNILIVSNTSSERTAYEFENIPCKNKLIFTPFDVYTPSSYHLNYSDDLGKFGMFVNETASGAKNILDIIAFCNHKDNYIRIK